MMNKNITYIILSLILISSCKKLVLIKSPQYLAFRLSPCIPERTIRKNRPLKLTLYYTPSDRIKQFENPTLNSFQKQWLDPEKNTSIFLKI